MFCRNQPTFKSVKAASPCHHKRARLKNQSQAWRHLFLITSQLDRSMMAQSSTRRHTHLTLPSHRSKTLAWMTSNSTLNWQTSPRYSTRKEEMPLNQVHLMLLDPTNLAFRRFARTSQEPLRSRITSSILPMQVYLVSSLGRVLSRVPVATAVEANSVS